MEAMYMNGRHYRPYRGQILNGHWKTHRKIGEGMHSGVYLLEYLQRTDTYTKYFAGKILTAEATESIDDNQSRELFALQRIAECEDINSLPVLRAHFRLTGPEGQHLVLVTDLLGPDLASFRKIAPNRALPVYTVRNIIAQVVDALKQLHELGIVHTDIKPSNILLVPKMTDEQITSWLEGIETDNMDMIFPLPMPYDPTCNKHQAELISIVLADLGQAQLAGQQPTVNLFSAYSLRAPETLLRSDFGPNLDIWTVGCLTFELITGRWLFHPEADEEGAWTKEDDHLARMLELSGDTFSDEVKQRAERWKEYFDDNGNLRRIPELCPVPLEEALGNYTHVPREECGPAAEFIRQCIRLDAMKRPSAARLESPHEEDSKWLAKAFEC